MDHEKAQFAWRYYVGLLAVLMAVSVFTLEGWLDLASWAVGWVGLAGLWGYTCRRRLGHRYFWAAYLGAFVASICYGVLAVLSAPAEWRVISTVIFAICGTLVLPLLYGLWLYAFRRPGIRQQRDAY